jgi:hypothetical protein
MRHPEPNTSWRQLITEEMGRHGDSWEDVEATTLTDAVLDRPFYDGYGSQEGAAFTLWTDKRVYFPVMYDGSEWAASVPRNPNAEATAHVGG